MSFSFSISPSDEYSGLISFRKDRLDLLETLFSWAPKSLQTVSAAIKLKMFVPWKTSYDKVDSILKSRDINLQTKIHIIKAMVFPVVMCEYESWTIKKAECRRIDALELW